PWGHAASGPPDIEVAGDDTDLAVVAMSNRGVLVRFRPSPRSDLARALGLGPASAGATEVAIDALEIEPDGAAVNAVVLGVPPDRLRWNARAPGITLRVGGHPAAGVRTTQGRGTAAIRRPLEGRRYDQPPVHRTRTAACSTCPSASPTTSRRCCARTSRTSTRPSSRS